MDYIKMSQSGDITLRVIRPVANSANLAKVGVRAGVAVAGADGREAPSALPLPATPLPCDHRHSPFRLRIAPSTFLVTLSLRRMRCPLIAHLLPSNLFSYTYYNLILHVVATRKS